MKYVIKKSAKSGQYWFNIVASDGQVLASSGEEFPPRSAAVYATMGR